jgi:hypothetical protein
MRTVFERRPFLAEFLERVAHMFELVIFTAGSQVCTIALSFRNSLKRTIKSPCVLSLPLCVSTVPAF